MLKSSDLVSRSDFQAGPLLVSPATRSVKGPAGTASIEPVVMKVLIALLDARGAVVTRGDLFELAWGGAQVGDDSLNRATARVRKILGDVAPGRIELETIPRTGYRLTGEDLTPVVSDGHQPVSPSSPVMSRRAMLVAAGGLAAAGVAGFGWWSNRSKEQRFNDLVKRGEEALEYGDGSSQSADYLRRAIEIRPGDGAAQGLFAYALMANSDNVNRASRGGDVAAAEDAIEAALRIDPSNANARLAQIQLDRNTLDLAETEDRLRKVLASAPNNIFAMRLLWNLLQSAGRSHDALALVQRGIVLKPLAAANNFPLAQLLWIVGRTAEADRIIDRAMEFWPAHPVVRFARFTIFAYTGRARAALGMLDNPETRPQVFSPASVALYRVSLTAMDQPLSANVSKARAANREAAKGNPKLAAQSALMLSALGDLDGAFEVANNLLLFRNGVGASSARPGQGRANSTAWRFTPWLFTPPAAAMRADPRFDILADGTGLSAYWSQRHIRPDYQVTA